MLVEKVRKFIKDRGLISRHDSVLAAVSGGEDSIALLHVLADLCDDLGFALEAAHLDHGIRGTVAENDALFVGKTCQGLGIACHVGRVDTPSFARSAKLSIEEAARELRYGFLTEKARARGHNKIALGHTKNDQAETVLMHLIRGAGLLGVSGMKPILEVGAKESGDATARETRTKQDKDVTKKPGARTFFVRPFLATNKAEITQFLSLRGISHVEDESNLDTTLVRNRVRIELIETLREKYNPRIVEVLASHAFLVAEAEDYLDKVGSEAYQCCVREETGENIQLELASFLSYHACVRGYIVREAFRRLCGSLKHLGFTHIAALINLASSGQSGDSVDISSGTSAWLDGGSLWVGHTSTLRSEDAHAPRFLRQLEPGRQVWLPDAGLEIDSQVLDRDVAVDRPGTARSGEDCFLKTGPDRVFFDLEKLERPLVLRNLEPGDRMIPFGMRGTRKVQDILVDLKVPRARRKRLVCFCDRNRLLWLVGIRRSNAAPVVETTRSVLSVRVATGRDEPNREKT